jgi:gliding motility-associated transport system ATP-binding protein
MIDVRHLRKQFGPFTAVDDVTFAMDRGEVLGFLGPNGAGKSTTMKMITGFLAPTSGTAIVCGADVTRQPIQAKKHVGYLPEGAPAYPDMTPASFLGFIAHIRGFGGAEARKRVGRAAELVDLGGVMQQPIETLSKGFRRRVGLAQALLHDPDVLILDEPTDGLDPNQKHEVRRLIAEIAANKAIIISTHILEEVDAVCTRAIIIARGRVLADATPAELEARSRYHNAVRLELDPELLGAARQELIRMPFVADADEIEDDGGRALLIFPRDGQPIVAEIGDVLRAHQWEARGFRVERGRLDDVFRRITTHRDETTTLAA